MIYKNTNRSGTEFQWQLCDCHGHLFTDRIWSELRGYMFRSSEGYAHIILCKLLHGPVETFEYVTHKDGNKFNNRCDNIIVKSYGLKVRCVYNADGVYRIFLIKGYLNQRLLVNKTTNKEEAIILVDAYNKLILNNEIEWNQIKTHKEKVLWLQKQL